MSTAYISLPDLASREGIALRGKGSTFWACCPFHDEKTPSFKISQWRQKWRFYCYGCGARGDVIDWVMLRRNVNHTEARRILGIGDFKPDPEMIRQRAERRRRERVIAAYRDRNPDCCCPDWLLEL